VRRAVKPIENQGQRYRSLFNSKGEKDIFGASTDIVSKSILDSATRPSGEVWLDRGAR